MPLPEDVDVSDPHPQVVRGRTRDQILAVLSAVAVTAAVVCWVADANLGPDSLVPGLTGKLWWCAAISLLAWMISAAERRVLVHLHRLEGEQYRDGYAAGYVDAASLRDANRERPGLRPVR